MGVERFIVDGKFRGREWEEVFSKELFIFSDV